MTTEEYAEVDAAENFHAYPRFVEVQAPRTTPDREVRGSFVTRGVKLVTGVLAATTIVVFTWVGYNQGVADNRVSPSDTAQYGYCMQYYHDNVHCYNDVFASWQK